MTITLFPGHPEISGDAPKLAFHEQGRYRAAAGHARRVLPGPVGELVYRELSAYAEFGYRFAGCVPPAGPRTESPAPRLPDAESTRHR